MNAFQVHEGGRGVSGAAPPIGQIHMGAITEVDVATELEHRGYTAAVHEPHHVPTPAPTLTKSMAINVALDEGISRMGLPRTSAHYYRCPSSAGCAIAATSWSSLINWVVQVGNGYLGGQYALPSWSQALLPSGMLHGAFSGLGGFADWLKQNTWFVQSVGDTITNYGEYLTAQNVKEAIEANTKIAGKALSKDDAMALVAALQAQGLVKPGQTETVAAGANAAASSKWLVPALVIGGVVGVVLLATR